MKSSKLEPLHGALHEEWRWAPGYEGSYAVSNIGRVRSHRPRYRSIRVLKAVFIRGYPAVSLCKDRGRKLIKVHKLVLEAFVGEKGDLVCRHLDGQRTNNALANLAWGTPTENCADRDRHGRSARGESNGMAKLSRGNILEIRKRKAGGARTADLATEFGVTGRSICNVVERRTWRWLR